MSIEWNKVTPLSKFLACIIFIGALPVLAFYIGERYMEAKAIIQSPILTQNMPTVTEEDTCFNTARNQAELDACAGNDLESVQKELDADYVKLENVSWVNPADVEKARATWTKYVTQECDAAEAINEGGSIYPMNYALCEASLTESHIKDLKSDYTEMTGKAPF